MSFTSHLRRVCSLLPIAALILASFVAGLPATGETVARVTAKPEGWITNFGQPSFGVPDMFQPHLERGRQLLAANDVEGAAGEFLECLRLMQPQMAAARKRGAYRELQAMEMYAESLAEVSVNLGQALYNMGRLDAAIDLFIAAADVAPGFWPAHHRLGVALIEKGLARHQERLSRFAGIGDIRPDAMELAWYRSAIVHLQVARQLDSETPRNAEVRLDLSRALRYWGDLVQAVDMAREALEIDPKDPRIHYNLGLALAARGELRAAVDAYTEAARLSGEEPKEFQAQIQDSLGLALAGLGLFQEAVQAYTQAVSLDPNQASYHNNLGAAQRAAGLGASQAAASHATAATLEPGGLEYWLNLATTHREMQDYDGAIAAYRRALRLNPNSSELHHQLGLTLYQRSDPTRAITTYGSLREAALTDEMVEAALAVVAVHALRGHRLRMVDAMDPRGYESVPRVWIQPDIWPGLRLALIRFWDVLDRNPLWGDARLALQQAVLDYPNAEPTILQAVSDYEKVLQVRSASVEVTMPIALPESLVRSLPADSPLKEAVEELPMEVRRATVAMAFALLQRDDSQEAIAELRWAHNRNPRSAHIANNLGKALFDDGKFAEAVSMYDRAIQLAPDVPEFYFNRGIARAYLGQMVGATQDWERAIAMGMEDVRLYTFLGIAHIQRAELDFAKAMLLKALLIDDTFAPAHYYLGLVEALRESASPVTGLAVERARADTRIGRPHYDVRGEFIRLNLLRNAFAELKKAEEADPERRAMYYYVGVEFGLQDPALAQVEGANVIHCVTRPQSLIPDWAVLMNNLAVVSALEGDLDKAERQLQLAIADEPYYAMAHWNLGRVLMLNKKEGEGEKALERAAELAEEQGLSYYFHVRKPTRVELAPLPREAAKEYRLKTLLEAFDIPVPVL